jgi:hypothetical protein
MHLMKETCQLGHEIRRKCFQTKGKTCRKCEDDRRRREEKDRKNHELELDREARQRAYSIKLAELQDDIAHARRLLRDVSDRRTREQVLAQHRDELKSLGGNPSLAIKDSPFLTPVNNDTVEPNTNTLILPLQGTKFSKSETLQPVSVPPSKEKDSVPAYSSAKEEWNYQKEFENASIEPIDKLMAMIGLEEVKEQFLTIKSKIDTSVRQNIDLKADRFGAAFLGNPGTGQGTIDFHIIDTCSLTSSRQNYSRSPVRRLLVLGRCHSRKSSFRNIRVSTC